MCFVNKEKEIKDLHGIDFNKERITEILSQFSTYEGRDFIVLSNLQLFELKFISKLFWKVFAKHFDWSRKCFYGVNLAESQRNLEVMRGKVAKIKDDELNKLFKKSARKFNELFPNHQIVIKEYKPSKVPKSPLFIDTLEEEKIESDIQKDVKAFLKPYLDGEITEENEPTDKKRLMTVLSEKYPEKDYKMLMQMALEVYLEETTWFFIRQLREMSRTDVDLTNSVRGFIEDLERAIKKDFPVDLLYKQSEIDENIIQENIVTKIEEADTRFDRIKLQALVYLGKVKTHNEAEIAKLQAVGKAPFHRK